MAKAREPKVFRSMDDLPLMLVVTVDTKNRLRITIYRNLTRWFLPLAL